MINLISENFREEVLNSSKPCIVTFKSNGCYLCRGLNNVLSRLAMRYDRYFKFGHIDMDVEHDLAKIFDIDAVPTMLWFRNGDGEEIPYPESPDAFSGYSEEYLVSYFNRLLSHG